jgi:Rod binding domain-containing protein
MEIGGTARIGVLQATAAQAARPGVAAPGVAAPDAAQTAAREFEAAFLTQAVEEMMRSVKTGAFGGGHGEEIWRSFLARAFADQIAAQDMTGLAGSVEAAITAYRYGMAGKPGG